MLLPPEPWRYEASHSFCDSSRERGRKRKVVGSWPRKGLFGKSQFGVVLGSTSHQFSHYMLVYCRSLFLGYIIFLLIFRYVVLLLFHRHCLAPVPLHCLAPPIPLPSRPPPLPLPLPCRSPPLLLIYLPSPITWCMSPWLSPPSHHVVHESVADTGS